jgi:4-oxalocrotonate tautomerase
VPLMQITLVEGRTEEQKRALLQALTKAAQDAIDAPIETIRAWIVEVPAIEFMVAGELQADRRRRQESDPQ